jgi:hypothetical protein
MVGPRGPDGDSFPVRADCVLRDPAAGPEEEMMKRTHRRTRRWLTGLAVAGLVLAGTSAGRAGIFFDQPPVTTVTPPPTGVSPEVPETPTTPTAPETPPGGPPPTEVEVPPPEVPMPPTGGTPPQVPEPGTLVLAGSAAGLAGLRAWRRR